jgi:hypothetical protein
MTIKVSTSHYFGMPFQLAIQPEEQIFCEHIADGVFIENLYPVHGKFGEPQPIEQLEATLKAVERQKNGMYDQFRASQTLHHYHYQYNLTHRFLVRFEGLQNDDEVENKLRQANRLILNMISLARILKPLEISSNLPKIISKEYNETLPLYWVFPASGFYSTAYSYEQDESRKFLTLEDIKEMSCLWVGMKKITEDEDKYRRIIQAFAYLNAAFHIQHPMIRHVACHAALESLIGTDKEGKGEIIKKRLPKVLSEISVSGGTETLILSASEIEEIYK